MKNITKSIQNSQKINLDELVSEYTFDFGLFTDLDDRLLKISDKWESLSYPNKIIMMLYAEYGSLRKVAALFHISHTTLSKYIQEIRETLLC